MQQTTLSHWLHAWHFFCGRTTEVAIRITNRRTHDGDRRRRSRHTGRFRGIRNVRNIIMLNSCVLGMVSKPIATVQNRASRNYMQRCMHPLASPWLMSTTQATNTVHVWKVITTSRERQIHTVARNIHQDKEGWHGLPILQNLQACIPPLWPPTRDARLKNQRPANGTPNWNL